MDSLTKIRAKINDFPGYGNETDIARSDQEIRAYAGERLAALQERLREEPEAAESLEPLIERAAFANQRVLAPLERPDIHPLAESAVIEADLNLLELADTAMSIDVSQLGDYEGRISAAFDARDAAIMQLKPGT